VQRVVFVWVWWLDRVAAGGIAKHAVAGHLDVEGMLFAVSEFLGQDPLCAFAATCQSMDSMPIFGPNQTLVVCVPDEFKMFLVKHVLGHRKLDLEPVGRPTGAKWLADFGGVESMGGGFLKERAREVRGRVDGELHPVGTGRDSFGELAG